MPCLPSGRRVEFSLDRFHALLNGMTRAKARRMVESLQEPDELLLVLDAVHFSREDGAPYFAGYVAADWSIQAADWSLQDRQALQAWLVSAAARTARAEAIAYIRELFLAPSDRLAVYPYLVPGASHRPGMVETSGIRH